MYHSDILAAERPFRAFTAIARRYQRNEIEALADALIDHLDGFDDCEDVPDFRSHSDGLPGDPADHEPGGDEEESAWVEPRILGGASIALMFGHEDAEEDDPSGQYDEDAYTADRLPKGYGPGCIISDNDFEHDGQERDEGEVAGIYGIDQSTGPAEFRYGADRNLMRDHIDRIRRERCDVYSRYGVRQYSLRDNVLVALNREFEPAPRS